MSPENRTRNETDGARCQLSNSGPEPYVVLMARHQEQLRRDMVARITKRNAAKQVTWTVTSPVTWTATNRVRDAVTSPVAAVANPVAVARAGTDAVAVPVAGVAASHVAVARARTDAVAVPVAGVAASHVAVARARTDAVAVPVAGVAASHVVGAGYVRAASPIAGRVTGAVASRVAGSVASRVTSTITIIVAMLVVLATNASARPTRDRDDDTEARDDDGDERDDMDDRGGVALEIEPDASSGATAGGPGLRQVPAIADVLEAAYDAAGLNRDPTRSWIRRARVAGLIPWVTVKTGWDQSWHDDEPGDVGRSRTFEVRATWRLDRLLFDGRELQVSSIDTARRRERRRLASRVIRAYFVWRKVAARGGLAAEAATAELDALTDGWFSERTKSGR